MVMQIQIPGLNLMATTESVVIDLIIFLLRLNSFWLFVNRYIWYILFCSSSGKEIRSKYANRLLMLLFSIHVLNFQ